MDQDNRWEALICCPFVNLEDSINDDCGMLQIGGDKLPTFKKKRRGQGGSEACLEMGEDKTQREILKERGVECCRPNLKTGS